MIQLGISAFYHDAAACLVKDGKVVLAAEEERFTEIKHDASFPINAIKWLLDESRINNTLMRFIYQPLIPSMQNGLSKLQVKENTCCVKNLER